jgi:GH24 family phage-related lysozyme (muramidase)
MEYLACLLRHAANFHKPSGYVVRPYPCPDGKGWHVGRGHRTQMIDFRMGKAVNLALLLLPSRAESGPFLRSRSYSSEAPV